MKRQCIHGNGNKRNNELLSSNDIPDAEINGDDHFSILFWWYGLQIFYIYIKITVTTVKGVIYVEQKIQQ